MLRVFYSKLIYFFMIAGMFFIISGCGSTGKDQENIDSISHTEPDVGYVLLEKNLSNPVVNIYEIQQDGTRTLKWTENVNYISSSKYIGKFKTHYNDIDGQKFYLYKFEGLNTARNKVILRALVKGTDIKNLTGNINISFLSEILFENIAPVLKESLSKDLQRVIDTQAKTLINDLNSDGDVNNLDILVFTLNNKSQITRFYRLKQKQIISLIYEGKFPVMFLDPLLYMLSKNFYISTMVLYKKKLFAIAGDGKFLIFSIKDVDSIKLISSTEIDVIGDKLIVSDNEVKIISEYGVLFIDISSLKRPYVKNFVEINKIQAVAINDKNLLALSPYWELQVLDIRDPENVHVVSSINMEDVEEIEVYDKKAFVLSKDYKLTIIDLKNLENLEIINSVYLDADYIDYPYRMDIADNKLFIFTVQGLLKIYDISNLKNITLLGSIQVPHINKILKFKDKLILSLISKDILILDIKNPAKPVSEYRIKSNLVMDFLIIDETLLAADIDGLKVFSLKAGNYTLHEKVLKLSEETIFDLQLKKPQKKLYIITGYGRFFILDVSNANNPVVVNSTLIPTYVSVQGFNVIDNKVIIIGYSAFSILDMTDPDNLTETGYLYVDHSINDVDIDKNGLIYVSNSNKLLVFEMDEYGNFVQKSYLKFYSSIEKIKIIENAVYTVVGNKLVIVDITDAPDLQTSSVLHLGHVSDIVIHPDADVLFVSSYNGELSVFDILDPVHPSLIKKMNIENPIGIAVTKDYLIVLSESYYDSDHKVVIIDISDILHPYIKGIINLPYASNIEIFQDNLIFFRGNNLIFIDMVILW